MIKLYQLLFIVPILSLLGQTAEPSPNYDPNENQKQIRVIKVRIPDTEDDNKPSQFKQLVIPENNPITPTRATHPNLIQTPLQIAGRQVPHPTQQIIPQ